MKLTTRQQQEIDFLSFYTKAKPLEEEIHEFVRVTVFGDQHQELRTQTNRLLLAKRSLEITAKQWREDLTCGLLAKEELLEDGWSDFPYFVRFLDNLLNGVTPEYRSKVLASGNGTVLAFTNFPKIVVEGVSLLSKGV